MEFLRRKRLKLHCHYSIAQTLFVMLSYRSCVYISEVDYKKEAAKPQFKHKCYGSGSWTMLELNSSRFSYFFGNRADK